MFQLTWKNKSAWQQATSGHTPDQPPQVSGISSIAWLDWEEHCVECAAPACYASCALFQRRRDNKCARFAYGIYPLPQARGQFRYGADITFRPWAKLQARWPGQPAMRSLTRSRCEERGLRFVDWSFDRLADLMTPPGQRRLANGANTWIRRFLTRRMGDGFRQRADTSLSVAEAVTADGAKSPDAFLLVVWSAQPEVDLQLEVATERPVYRRGFRLQAGWNRIEIPFAEIAAQTQGQPGRILLWMNNEQDVRLIFSWLGLVKFCPRAVTPPEKLQPAQHVKCVAWDLDHTLWNGVIGDDGADNVDVNPSFVDLIRQFDERGILQTIVSKNTWDVAWPKIESLGLAPYFLYPAIHWGPKSASLKSIAAELNINIDTFAVIDDNPFERREISHALPQVRTYDPVEFHDPFARPEFQLPLSAESRHRRASYQAEATRRRVHAEHGGDFQEFLASCNMVLHIATPDEQQIPRCLELVQRSNQFNLSTRRYSEPDFRELLANPARECFALRVDDNFGSYGIVGFCAFRHEHSRAGSGTETILMDFVLSCRVAQKCVEQAFLQWYARQLQQRGQTRLLAELTVTDRNQPLRDELRRVGFVHRDTSGSGDAPDEASRNDHPSENSQQRVEHDGNGHAESRQSAADSCLLNWQWTHAVHQPHVIQIDDEAVRVAASSRSAGSRSAAGSLRSDQNADSLAKKQNAVEWNLTQPHQQKKAA